MVGSWYRHIALLASLTICLSATLSTAQENTQENMKKLATANNYLALDIFCLLPSNENVFFSPFSLSSAFAMLYFGTRGETAQELRNVLGYEKADLPEELVHQTFQKYLKALSSTDPSAYILNSANSVLVNKTLDVEPSYVKGVQYFYQAEVKEVDFVKDNQQVVQEVNSWVKNKTNGKIEKLLDELDPSTILLLLNAVYFKGTWKTQFNSSKTIQQTFYNKGIEAGAKKVPMMRLTEKFLYTSVDDAQAIEMPYKGENISMVVLLPYKRDGVECLEKRLSLEKLHEMRNRMYKTEVHLRLPKFKVEYEREMSADFKSLGAVSIFRRDADFSGITSSREVVVSKVLHKAIIEVNEEGSEAAAVTGIVIVPLSDNNNPTPYFNADHPFLFAIVDRRNDMILFVGRVTEF